MKPITVKKPAKDQREKQVLLGLVDLYIESGKPVGSNTLRENGFEHLSSATIRNYFAKLEAEGYLIQQHSSGGRIPTPLAYKFYAQTQLAAETEPENKNQATLRKHLVKETREIAAYMQHAAEMISENTNCAVFLSSPRFDHDFILDVKLVGIDHSRCLCILITDFGLVHTETLYAEKKLSNFSLKRIESYFRWRMTGIDKPKLTEEEELLAGRFYNEVMLRHIVGHNNFSHEDILRTGFSKLLMYPDFNDASALAGGLALFENPNALRTLLRECCKTDRLNCWIGDELGNTATTAPACSVIAAPYYINQTIAGAIAILGPNRISYKQLFGMLQTAAEHISESLTKSLYKFKISFRQPNPTHVEFKTPETDILGQTRCLLLEDKTVSHQE